MRPGRPGNRQKNEGQLVSTVTPGDGAHRLVVGSADLGGIPRSATLAGLLLTVRDQKALTARTGDCHPGLGHATPRSLDNSVLALGLYPVFTTRGGLFPYVILALR